MGWALRLIGFSGVLTINLLSNYLTKGWLCYPESSESSQPKPRARSIVVVQYQEEDVRWCHSRRTGMKIGS